jgi:hypothetical protein
MLITRMLRKNPIRERRETGEDKLYIINSEIGQEMERVNGR